MRNMISSSPARLPNDYSLKVTPTSLVDDDAHLESRTKSSSVYTKRWPHVLPPRSGGIYQRTQVKGAKLYDSSFLSPYLKNYCHVLDGGL